MKKDKTKLLSHVGLLDRVGYISNTTGAAEWAALSFKQKRFISVYFRSGDYVKAAEFAAVDIATAKSWTMSGTGIMMVLKEQYDTGREIPAMVACADERRSFWSAIMRDDTQEMKDRLKASELLGRAEHDFTDANDKTQSGNGVVVFNVVTGIPRAPGEPEKGLPGEFL